MNANLSRKLPGSLLALCAVLAVATARADEPLVVSVGGKETVSTSILSELDKDEYGVILLAGDTLKVKGKEAGPTRGLRQTLELFDPNGIDVGPFVKNQAGRTPNFSYFAESMGAHMVRVTGDPGGFAGHVSAYFSGDFDALRDLEVEPGGSPFQRRVWAALRKIRPGRTACYGEIARSIGRSSAARAVGAANARNPVALAIPCHRVIGSNGSLTGYAGGIARKRWLLNHEGVQPGK